MEGFSKMTQSTNKLILDTPVPHISTPILIPTKTAKVKSLKSMAKNAYSAVRKKITDVADWILNLVPEPIKKPVNEKLEALKQQVSNIFKKWSLHAHDFEIRESESALKGFTKQFTIDGHEGIDPQSFLDVVETEVTKLLSQNRQTKVNLILTCTMERVNIKTGEVTITNAPFRSNTVIILDETDVKELYRNASDKIIESMASFQMRGSNWQFRSVVNLDINTAAYKPLRSNSYFPLPKELASKKAIINPKNKDDECFKWCIARALNPVDKNAERIDKNLQKQAEKFDWQNINFPVSLSDISKFEHRNKGIYVNVFGYEGEIYPLRHTKHENAIDLLLISNEEKKHYCLIKNFKRLLGKNGNPMHYCKRCLNGFTREEALIKHKEYCNQEDAVRVVLPEPGTMLDFKNYNRSMKVPFVIYADFESCIKPLDTCQPSTNKSFTRKIQKHIPISFCIYVKCFDDSVYLPHTITFTAENEDDDVGQIFVDKLEEIIKQIYNQTKFAKKIIYTEENKKNFTSAVVCHICEGKLGKDRVRDHCHLTGKYRGAAHENCNLNYRIPKFIPVFFHNLSGYDSHLFIKKLKTDNGEEINCISKTEENYISFSKKVIVDKFIKDEKEIQIKRELRFIDSFKFMASSLDALSKNLSEYKNLGRMYSGKQFDLLRRKGIFPYEHIDSVDRLNEVELPPKSAFYSKLNDTDITDEDYKHAEAVWKEFRCKTLREYLDLYNKSDVLILADVFENFRDLCINNYKLDPAWYYTSPGLAWDAALRKTGVELELLSDPDMLLMVKRGIRGGISTISKRYAKANNKYMGEAYNPDQPSNFITYMDANNLYGWAMSKKLPTQKFKWMKDKELENWRDIPCILEVDLKYSKNLHDPHNDYPLAPENIKLPDSTVTKLIPNLSNKKKYIVHHETLKLYESLGLKVRKIHRGIKFSESAWLEKYICLNTDLRIKAKNDFEKDFFKLMNNSVFGKTMENIDKRVDIRLVCNENKAIKLVAKPNYDCTTIFDKNLIAVHMQKTKVYYNKPIYLGMSILDLSKNLMYDFHYNYVKTKYGDKAELLFTDTDSLMYEIQTEDFYKDIADDVNEWFDTSDIPSDHPSGIKSGVNKKVIGKFKDEACGKQIEEFVGLRSKLYSFKLADEDHKKCKGIKKNIIKKAITHEDYKNCLFTGEEHRREMIVIQSEKHDIYTQQINKIALSAEDDKRVVQGIHTKAYGHYEIIEQINVT